VTSYIALNYWELAAASVFVFIDAGLSVVFGLKVHRSLLVAAVRMVVQLALVGLVLTTLFSVESPLWAHDLIGADALLPHMIADSAFDADARVLQLLAAAGKSAVIPPRPNCPRRQQQCDDHDRSQRAKRGPQHDRPNLCAGRQPMQSSL
jgi:hypothetical protein